ncbi:MAG: hypothetical protein JOZ32_21105, partial [Bryobacterales bacterium]|nr:hypothetical protein [Bryobacterales bacterium]
MYMPKFKLFSSLATLAGFAVVSAHADDAAAIQKKLVSEYALTQPTADKTDIVTAGAILVLQKSDLVMGPTTSSAFYINVYKEGKIQPNVLAKSKSIIHRIGQMPGIGVIPGVGTAAGTAAGADSNSGASPRTYVTGEKLWVTKIEVKNEPKEEDVTFSLFTNAVNDVRYQGSLKFPLPKGATEDQVDKVVAEVFKVQPPEEAKQEQPPAGGQPGQPAAPAGAQTAAAPPVAPAAPGASAPLPDIPPPPPPADQPAAPPPTVKLGQTPDEVIAALGQPQKIVKLAKKETYYYKDLKVIFVA